MEIWVRGELDDRQLDDLTREVLGYQVAQGGTHLVTPYMHVADVNSRWLECQIRLFRATRRWLDERGIRLPVVAVVDLGWRPLARPAWPGALEPMLAAIDAAGFEEIALAGSNVDRGAHPEERLMDLLLTVRQASQVAPVIAWNQGRFGEQCVAAGARGYETGIGWRERCDTPGWSRAHRAPMPSTGVGPRPIYVDMLMRSIPKATIAAMSSHRGVGPDLPCVDSPCCRNGVSGLLGDSRHHTLYGRVRSMRALAQTDRTFRWVHLAGRADEGLDLAARINLIAGREGLPKVDDSALRAGRAVGRLLHATRRLRAA